jgi:hypothetical protein
MAKSNKIGEGGIRRKKRFEGLKDKWRRWKWAGRKKEG